MHVGMKKIVAKDLPVKDANTASCQSAKVDAACLQLFNIPGGYTAYVLHDQHLARRQRPVNFGDVEIGGVLEVVFKKRGAGRLGAHVQLAHDHAFEFGHDVVGADAFAFRVIASYQARQRAQQANIAADLFFYSGAHHLADHRPSVLEPGGRHLGNGCRRHEHVVEFIKQIDHRCVEFAFVDGACLPAVNWGQFFVEPGQVVGDIGGEKVAAGRDGLAKLDVNGAQVLQGEAQPGAARQPANSGLAPRETAHGPGKPQR